jgi:NADH-quinone oxidoreductase subunit J
MVIGGLTPEALAFGFFTILTLGGAVGVVMNRNLVRGAMWLIVSLFGIAGMFVLLSAPFLAATQVLVYIGAIGILFTFTVMLTRSMTNLKIRFTDQWWSAAIVVSLFFLFLMLGLILPSWGNQGLETLSPIVATTTDLGIALVDGNQYVLPFEVVSLLLTATMIGAIVIARSQDEE